jgi:hypothetical protein
MLRFDPSFEIVPANIDSTILDTPHGSSSSSSTRSRGDIRDGPATTILIIMFVVTLIYRNSRIAAR